MHKIKPPGLFTDLFLPLAAANANSLANEDDVHQLLRSPLVFMLCTSPAWSITVDEKALFASICC